MSPAPPPVTQPPPASWALRILFFAIGVAISLALQGQKSSSPDGKVNLDLISFVQRLLGKFLPPSHDLQTQTQTYCYQSILSSGINPVPGVNCFSVRDGRFVRVFSSTDPATRERVEIRQGHALPGLWDGHGHLLQYGEFLHSVDLFGAESFEEVRRRIGEYVEKNPDAGTRSRWVRGVGWDQMRLGGMPSAADEDERLKGKYIMLDRVDVHCTWVSSAVLQLLPNLPAEVPGGEIVRDPGLGVFCDNAMDLVMPLWPRPSREQKKEFVRSAMRSLHSVGLVGIHDAGVTPEDIALYEEMANEEGNGWTMRVYAMIECPERNSFCPEVARKVEHPMLRVRSVKLFADGALGSWGSALLEPYSDRPDTSGSLLVNATTLTKLARSWASAGYQVNIHAIGDRANRLAIDALEAALNDVCPPSDEPSRLVSCQQSRRFRIEHAQIIHPADQVRLHALGIIPSIQPTHATSDMSYAELRLGPERIAFSAYRMRSLLDLAPCLGSDFPVEPANPFGGLYAAVARKDPKSGKGGPGKEKDGWYRKEEGLSLAEALDGFTKGAVRAAFWEKNGGEIKEGMWADWVVVDRELGGDEEDLRRVKVKETWVAGRKVYEEDESWTMEDL